MMKTRELLCIGSEPWERASALYVRYRVFVLERNIAKEDEFDRHDEKGRVYANLYLDRKPVSTGRFLPIGQGQARLTRIATLKKYRGNGYASKIIRALEDYALEVGIHQLLIHSELTAKSFYESLGYQATSDIYQEDGEWCQTLTKTIT
ncbi:GNAT family N-acetyltransferase [Streptococcus ruminantium]|uniref:GNAT family N-acetyltransferase n=2 Tax=Streptococcus ruminantium TaxID=1917441 RepID=A0A2Z5TPC5_9STRE|nr:GNAT family N-acetyltransferase [Streptococcus ruminantium]BBA92977.1 GNAT family N-acetyltransferase [Streptococcus ruminantium]